MLAGNVTGIGRRGRLTEEQKGKAKTSKPRRPHLWAPDVNMPNQPTGVLTRARRSLAHEYTKQRHNDAVIEETIADLSEGRGDAVVDLNVPDSHPTLGSMHTLNVNLCDSVFKGDGWRTHAPILQAHVNEATHPGATPPAAAARPMLEMPTHLQGLYTDWSVGRAGWAVIVPNRFLTEASFHTGYTPSWTQGEVIGEGVNLGTGQKMILVDLGWCDMERFMEEKEVRVARGPNVDAIGSEGVSVYGWKPQLLSLGSNAAVAPLGDENMNGEEPVATQDSTARTTFPKVSSSLPQYMLDT